MKRDYVYSILVLTLSFAPFVYAQSGWFWQNPLPQGNSLFSVDFVEANIGYAVGDIGTIIRTTYGGQTWDVLNSGTTESLSDVDFVDANTGLAVGGYGTILRTNDSG